MIRVFAPADIEFIDVPVLGCLDQLVLATGTIGLEIDLSMGVCGLHKQYFTRLHLVEDDLGFQDGQGAIQSLGIELHRNGYLLPVFYRLRFGHKNSLTGLDSGLYILIFNRYLVTGIVRVYTDLHRLWSVVYWTFYEVWLIVL
jgi:hypothetical protein